MEGGFEREYILHLLRKGVKTEDTIGREEEASFYALFRKRLETKSAGILDS